MILDPLGFAVSDVARSRAAGGRHNGRPGQRPQDHANDDGAFAFDPDGHDVEAVCHAPED